MIKKEFLIFLLLSLVLAFGIHMNQWLTHPLTLIKNLGNHAMPYHPLLYTFLVYLILAFFRLIFRLILKLFRSH